MLKERIVIITSGYNFPAYIKEPSECSITTTIIVDKAVETLVKLGKKIKDKKMDFVSFVNDEKVAKALSIIMDINIPINQKRFEIQTCGVVLGPIFSEDLWSKEIIKNNIKDLLLALVVHRIDDLQTIDIPIFLLTL